MAINDKGELWSWGQNRGGELGTGSCNDRQEPKKVSIPITVRDLDCGYFHSMAVDRDGHVWTWGSNDCGQLGFGWPPKSKRDVGFPVPKKT